MDVIASFHSYLWCTCLYVCINHQIKWCFRCELAWMTNHHFMTFTYKGGGVKAGGLSLWRRYCRCQAKNLDCLKIHCWCANPTLNSGQCDYNAHLLGMEVENDPNWWGYFDDQLDEDRCLVALVLLGSIGHLNLRQLWWFAPLAIGWFLSPVMLVFATSSLSIQWIPIISLVLVQIYSNYNNTQPHPK